MAVKAISQNIQLWQTVLLSWC